LGLVRIGPIVLDLDDVRAIADGNDPSREGGKSVEVTFRDGSKMIFHGAQAEALRSYVQHLPDGIPVSGRANDAVMGVLGGPEDCPAVERQQGQ
jgi:hypothetical protein